MEWRRPTDGKENRHAGKGIEIEGKMGHWNSLTHCTKHD